jgi:hypothetical protein
MMRSSWQWKGQTMVARFNLAERGRAFATRGRAQELRAEAIALAGSQELIVDFEGVAHVTYSFADELLGKLRSEHGICVTPINMVRHVERVVDRALISRAGPLSQC